MTKIYACDDCGVEFESDGFDEICPECQSDSVVLMSEDPDDFDDDTDDFDHGLEDRFDDDFDDED